jgi:hypothetical protein
MDCSPLDLQVQNSGMSYQTVFEKKHLAGVIGSKWEIFQCN